MEYIIFIVIGVLIAAVIVRDVWATRQLNQRYAVEYVLTMIPHKKFSLAEYYEQIERAQTEILQERESEPKYEIILWWGLDGCKLDGHGNIVWISKRKKKSEDKQENENNGARLTHYVPAYYPTCYPTYYGTPYNYTPYCLPLSAQIASGRQMTNAAVDAGIAELTQSTDAEIQKLQLQVACCNYQAQVGELINSIKPMKEHTS